MERAIVRPAASAREAFQILSCAPVDVVISDIGMPGETGYELIHKIRALPARRGGHEGCSLVGAASRVGAADLPGPREILGPG